MKCTLYSLVAFCACLFAPAIHAQGTIVDSSTKESFPDEITFDANGKQYQLDATGVATRKKLVFKVYSIAHYLQKGAAANFPDKMQAILSDNTAKQFTMRWVRDVDAARAKEAFQEAFHRVFNEQQYSQLKPVISQFEEMFNREARKGDEYIIRWVPGGTVSVIIDGKTIGTVNNAEFAKGLWNIWFGPNSIVNSNDLLSQMK